MAANDVLNGSVVANDVVRVIYFAILGWDDELMALKSFEYSLTI
jgi:hypothetical protein